MKIDCAILSSTLNPVYLDFWPLASARWQALGVTPVLAKISNRDTDFYQDGFGLVKEFKTVEGVPNYFQALLIRLYLPKFFPDKFCILSDIDLLPIVKDYFFDNKVNQTPDSFVLFRSNSHSPEDKRYAFCYQLATGKVFTEMFNLNQSFKDFIQAIWQKDQGFVADERFLYQKLNAWLGPKILLQRGWEKKGKLENRIDRPFWQFSYLDVVNDKFYDIHLIRPYQYYKKQIDYLIKLINKKHQDVSWLEHQTQRFRRWFYRLINPEKIDYLKGRFGQWLKKYLPETYKFLKPKVGFDWKDKEIK